MPAGKHEYMSCKVNGSWGACRVSSFFWAFSLRKLSWQALCAKDCAHPACDSFFFLLHCPRRQVFCQSCSLCWQLQAARC